MEHGETTRRCIRSSGTPAAAATTALMDRAPDGDDRLARVLRHEAEHRIHRGGMRSPRTTPARATLNPPGQRCTVGDLPAWYRRGQGLLGPVAHVDLDVGPARCAREAERPGDQGRGLGGSAPAARCTGARRLGQGGDPPGRRRGLPCPFSERWRPPACPGSILPVVGVVPWRTRSTAVAGGAFRRRRDGGVSRRDGGTGAHRRLCVVVRRPCPEGLLGRACSGRWQRAAGVCAWSAGVRRWRAPDARRSRTGVLGPWRPGVRRSRASPCSSWGGSGGARCQPDGPDVHRGPVR